MCFSSTVCSVGAKGYDGDDTVPTSMYDEISMLLSYCK